jgi:hypothetical protein
MVIEIIEFTENLPGLTRLHSWECECHDIMGSQLQRGGPITNYNYLLRRSKGTVSAKIPRLLLQYILGIVMESHCYAGGWNDVKSMCL